MILPCDPIALVERLDIMMASKAAGNTGVRNELLAVCDELLRQNLIDKHKYKNNYVAIIKMLITKRSYKKKYVIGGAGIFGSIGKFFCENVLEECGKAISVDSSSGRKNCGKRYRNESY